MPDIISLKEAGWYKGSEERFYAYKLMQGLDIQSEKIPEKSELSGCHGVHATKASNSKLIHTN